MLISASLMLDSADWLLPGFLERSWPLLGFSLGLLWGSFGAPSGILLGILAAFWDGLWRITGAFTTLGRRLKWSWRSLQDSFPGIRHELIINLRNTERNQSMAPPATEFRKGPHRSFIQDPLLKDSFLKDRSWSWSAVPIQFLKFMQIRLAKSVKIFCIYLCKWGSIFDPIKSLNLEESCRYPQSIVTSSWIIPQESSRRLEELRLPDDIPKESWTILQESWKNSRIVN